MPHGRRPSIDAPGQRRERDDPADRMQVEMKRLLWLAALAIGFGAGAPSSAQSPGNFSTLSTTGTATMGGDALMCSGRPWIDVRCNGAVGDGSHDDTTAINATISTAIANNWPVHISAGTYKVTSPISIDYAGQASKGFRLISEGATIDGRAIPSAPVLKIQCGGGSASSPTGCFYFRQEGVLLVNASTPAYAVVVGKADLSKHNSHGSRAPALPKAPAAGAWCSKMDTISAIPSRRSISKYPRPAYRSPSTTMGSTPSSRPISTASPRSMRQRAAETY